MDNNLPSDFQQLKQARSDAINAKDEVIKNLQHLHDLMQACYQEYGQLPFGVKQALKKITDRFNSERSN